MKKMSLRVAIAAATAVAALASTGALAQSAPVEIWQPTHKERDPAKRIPPPPQTEAETESAQVDTSQPPAARPAAAVSAPAHPAAAPVADMSTRDRGGFFIGVQGGKGWVYDDVDQSAQMVNAGYRWQAGPVALIGVELAGGQFDGTQEDGFTYPGLDFARVGATARFNFGRDSRVFGLVHTGYWSADIKDSDERIDGAYVGVGLGVDFTSNFNMSLVYTNHVYFENYFWDNDNNFIYEINRADTLMLGAELRF